jgi:hypothetical protein
MSSSTTNTMVVACIIDLTSLCSPAPPVNLF